ncbi:MAG TPA: DUF2520 domain-containing protein [Chitinophagaceae bacterium]|nr:DUF2520 domain-containing protein [Chitinophagaceae bacterium]
MQLSFSIVGTGNMAWFLAERLNAAGHHFEGIYGRNLLAANEIVAQYPALIYSAPEAIPDKENHICLLAVKDDAIPAIAAQLHFQETVLVHTAGSVSIELLADAAVHYGVVWPVYSITRGRHFLRQDIPMVTQSNDHNPLTGILAVSISPLSGPMSEAQRFQLHMAAVFANNFTNHLIAVSESLCAGQHIAFDYLKPLIEQTFERLQQQSPGALQTGPARRGDQATQQKHMDLLQNQPELAAVYQSLSISIRKMYENHEQ